MNKEGFSKVGLLNNKVVLVTGSATGIGTATVNRFASEGATVVCGDIHTEEVLKTVDQVMDGRGKAKALSLDVSDVDSVQAFADYVKNVF